MYVFVCMYLLYKHLVLAEKEQELKELKGNSIKNLDAYTTLNKDIESYKEKITTFQEELTQACDKNKILKKEVEEKEMSITKLEKGSNCYITIIILIIIFLILFSMLSLSPLS